MWKCENVGKEDVLRCYILCSGVSFGFVRTGTGHRFSPRFTLNEPLKGGFDRQLLPFGPLLKTNRPRLIYLQDLISNNKTDIKFIKQ